MCVCVLCGCQYCAEDLGTQDGWAMRQKYVVGRLEFPLLVLPPEIHQAVVLDPVYPLGLPSHPPAPLWDCLMVDISSSGPPQGHAHPPCVSNHLFPSVRCYVQLFLFSRTCSILLSVCFVCGVCFACVLCVVLFECFTSLCG